MRKLIVSVITSLDGYFEGPGGNIMALPMDDFFDAHNLERIRSADTLLYGAKTYRGMQSFWPAVAEDPEPMAAAGNGNAEVLQEIGQRSNAAQKVVVSDSLTDDDLGSWLETTSIVRRADAHEFIAKLKEQPGQDIVMFGSGTLSNDLLAAGLVDDLYVMVAPTILGAGTPAFTAPTSLRLLETRRHDGSDNVLLHFEARR
jgi:dihydrofolate reductase